MSQLYSLKIKNFRGIKDFRHTFGWENYCVLIGRGDSGKSTILKAISYLLSPLWNLNITDLDFYNLNIEEPIIIEGIITDIPNELRNFEKFGQYIQVIDKDGNVCSNIEDVEGSECLKIRLLIDDALEPKWFVVSDRELGDKEISHRDREKFKMFIISDYVDSHFSLSKGSPLLKLINSSSTDSVKILRTIFTDLSREVYKVISQTEKLDDFKSSLATLKSKVHTYGLRVEDLIAMIEFTGSTYSESNITIHAEKIPARLLGKGSKRLISIALQMELISEGGIVLIDELEQGLESDRIRHLVKHLFKISKGQIFITTHSNDVLVEAKCNQVFLMKKDAQDLISFNRKRQGILRKHPKAFYGTRVLSCEGATEEGIVRILGDYIRNKTGIGLEARDLITIDASGGKEFYKMAKELFELDFKVAVFCDSDTEKELAGDKAEVLALNIPIIQCEDGLAIEQQIFQNLPWEGVLELVEWAIENSGKTIFPIIDTNISKIEDIINTPEDIKADICTKIGNTAKNQKRSWYKNIDGGEKLGETILKYWDRMDNQNPLKMEFQKIINWIEEE